MSAGEIVGVGGFRLVEYRDGCFWYEVFCPSCHNPLGGCATYDTVTTDGRQPLFVPAPPPHWQGTCAACGTTWDLALDEIRGTNPAFLARSG